MKLVAETFQCAKKGGTTEFGFTFKREGSDDAEFDLVVGDIVHSAMPDTALEHYRSRIKATQWVADAIVAAANEVQS